MSNTTIVKLTCMEADAMFPITSENIGMPDPSLIELKHLNGVWGDVVSNTGEQTVKEWGEPTLYDCMKEKTTTDEHGDRLLPVADYKATMADGTQHLIKFVALM